MPRIGVAERPRVDSGALRRIRKAAGLTLLDAARVARVVPETVAEWEYGETAPSPRQLSFLARACGVGEDVFCEQQS